MCDHWPLKTINDAFFRRQVMALKVRCSNKALGCEWVGGLGELEEHMKVGSVEGECEYVRVACPYKCGKQIQRRSLVVHRSDACACRPFSCRHCKHEGTYEEITRDHWLQCQKYPLECPNKCCEEVIERRFLKRHLDQDCPLQEIECEFSYAGCGSKVKRMRMQEHMDGSVKEHLHTLAKYSKDLQESMNELRTSAESTKTQLHALSIAINQISPQPIIIPPPQIVMSNFEEHKNNNVRWYSPSFYTHIGGYKICLHIDANGWGDAQGTHVGVSMFMMRGEFDDLLQWPFKGVVRVRLVNQQRGGDDFERNIVEEDDYLQDSEAFLCVFEGDKSSEGWGCCDFIPHSELYKPAEGKVYLRNDSLKFEVIVSHV